MNLLLILSGKIVIFISKILNLGNGSTWPGHIALNIDKNFIKNIIEKNKDLKIILIAGTNGKTTTGKLIQTILEGSGKRVFQNTAGANLLNGVVSSLTKFSSISGKINFDYAIFEIDENTLPLILKNIKPEIIILINLFRDQLDRYGEVNAISKKWKDALASLGSKTSLILNSDDPQIAYLGDAIKNEVKYFGVKGRKLQNTEHASDSTYCPKCGNKLSYRTITFSHLGDWKCSKGELKRPKTDLENFEFYPLPGLYNKYNTNAAVLTARELGISNEKIKKALTSFQPAFGRQEIIKYKNKKIQIFLSKNPASFNQSLNIITELKATHLLIILNDRIPDGRDVSWIWDVDFEKYLENSTEISVAGDRACDMALRLKYAGMDNFKTYESLKIAVTEALKGAHDNEILYTLPTYSAMLDLRKILTGKSIL
ncbi:MAG: Mur ligase family protein [Patescibacteria group bacterium]